MNQTTEGILMTSKKELRALNKEELLEIINDLTDKNEELIQNLNEKNEIIEKYVTNYWSWDDITEKFDAINDISKALTFLNKVLAEKAICSDKRCPVFPTLHEIKKKKFLLVHQFNSVFDLKTARSVFARNKKKLIAWEKLYWEIRFMLENAFHEITQIGIPNENERRDIMEAHERENITIKNLGEARMAWQGPFAENVDDGLKRDRDLQRGKHNMKPLTPDHPEYQIKHGVFAKEQAALAREQSQKKKQKRNQ